MCAVTPCGGFFFEDKASASIKEKIRKINGMSEKEFHETHEIELEAEKKKAKMCGQVCEIQKPAIVVPN